MIRKINPIGYAVTAALLLFVSGCGSSTNSKISQPAVVEDFTNSIGMKFVKIPAGEFIMGHEGSPAELVKRSPGSNPKWFNGVPAHKVRISRPFAIGMHEVTRGQFAKFVEATGYRTECEADGQGGYHFTTSTLNPLSQSPEFTWRNPGFEQADDHPVVQVTWNDAVAFTEWLSTTEGKRYRLPSEAEWEYVCKAGSNSLYQLADVPSSLAKAGNVGDSTFEKQYPNMMAVKCNDNVLYTCPVGKFQPNAFRVFDMHGNAAEFCRDYFVPYSEEDVTDPAVLEGEEVCVRGGGWNGDAETSLSAFRYQLYPTMRASVLGFRVVVELPDTETTTENSPTPASE